MEDELTRQLKKILDDIKRLQNQLNPNALQPADLDWNNYLMKMPYISIYFNDLLENITPLLRYFVIYPTKHDSPDPRFGIDALLCANDIPEIISENAACKKRYQEQIHDLGLESTNPKEREDNLDNQINDMNMVCQSAERVASELISRGKLTERNNNFKPITAPKKPPFDLLEALITGEFRRNPRALQVPPHLEAH
ncbi:hypothetical protein TRFO_07584 [Tritrichomonas foetus]|uniref:Mediator of RNA polymerase II transcription subunit 8 n=1 Tax=Tritrichomonas foetus TaxID=1144522 RepID=A0A1J4JUZ5_9EUKA|nr:hypothetical protein TRFO_07584 [Tritrichomonas foetus]|eukprot:OHT01350.1 hypothetical protein TRFO_07584 [Tritrichomonas foetus]